MYEHETHGRDDQSYEYLKLHNVVNLGREPRSGPPAHSWKQFSESVLEACKMIFEQQCSIQFLKDIRASAISWISIYQTEAGDRDDPSVIRGHRAIRDTNIIY